MFQIFLSKLDLLIIRLLILPLRLMQSTLLLMECLCQILHCTVLLLGAWSILRLLVLILLTLFMLLVSLLFLVLQLIGQFFFIFYSIFEVQSFRVFYFHPLLLWRYMHTPILIMAMTPLIASMLLVFVSFWMILLFLGRVRKNPLFLYLQLKRSIVLWHPLPKRLFCYVGCL